MIEQFYKLSQDLTARKDLKSSDKIVYAVIVDHIGENEKGWPGKRRIMAKTGLCGDTVCKAIERLELAGDLVVDRRGNGKSNYYTTGQRTRPVRESDRRRSENQTGSGQRIRPEPDRLIEPDSIYVNF